MGGVKLETQFNTIEITARMMKTITRRRAISIDKPAIPLAPTIQRMMAMMKNVIANPRIGIVTTTSGNYRMKPS